MINYLGVEGITQNCLEALALVLQINNHVGKAILISGPADSSGCRSHAFLMDYQEHDKVIIRAGFASGYPGEGPKGLSRALALLDYHDYDVRQVEVKDKLFDKLNSSALSQADIDKIEHMPRMIDSRVWDYILRDDFESNFSNQAWRGFPIHIPLSLIDPRILDLAKDFWSDPDAALNKGYRRLEDVIRERTSLKHHGSKLMSAAFNHEDSPLTWREKSGNSKGLAGLFTSVFQAFRNPRAHSIHEKSESELVTEFLLLNSLFTHEACAIERETEKEETNK